jgi:predicted Holliday junction resolvase-like endonuclease
VRFAPTPDQLLGAAVGLAGGLVVALLVGLIWKLKYTRAIRRDAVRRSLAVTGGKVHEQLVPHLPGFEFDPRDARFLGAPVDYVVFEGLADGRVDRVVFLEVKTGRGTLNGRERQVRDAIEAGRVAWAEWRIAADGRRSGSR